MYTFIDLDIDHAAHDISKSDGIMQGHKGIQRSECVPLKHQLKEVVLFHED